MTEAHNHQTTIFRRNDQPPSLLVPTDRQNTVGVTPSKMEKLEWLKSSHVTAVKHIPRLHTHRSKLPIESDFWPLTWTSRMMGLKS